MNCRVTWNCQYLEKEFLRAAQYFTQECRTKQCRPAGLKLIPVLYLPWIILINSISIHMWKNVQSKTFKFISWYTHTCYQALIWSGMDEILGSVCLNYSLSGYLRTQLSSEVVGLQYGSYCIRCSTKLADRSHFTSIRKWMLRNKHLLCYSVWVFADRCWNRVDGIGAMWLYKHPPASLSTWTSAPPSSTPHSSSLCAPLRSDNLRNSDTLEAQLLLSLHLTQLLTQ